MPAYYIGLMSGTSVDGIDAVLVDFSADQPQLICTHCCAWDAQLHQRIQQVLDSPETTGLPTLGELDAELGEGFAQAVLALLEKAGVPGHAIKAIGSHGQTLFHAADAARPFSIQCGDPNRIAELTGIDTVADFRRRDIAAGGQGAPLVPAFHQALFRTDGISRAIVNIGGIANLTLLPSDPSQAVTGFDTGPGNTLMDAWTRSSTGKPYDDNGAWGAAGQPLPALLERLLAHEYFRQAPPKSTGRELFNLDWLGAQGGDQLADSAAEDVQATLAELTVKSIADSLRTSLPDAQELYVCGGGAHNGLLLKRLAEVMPGISVTTTATLGLSPDWVEATAFAWLAWRTLERRAGNLTAVTGARHPVILGGIFPGQPA